jgi:predicted PhzF superfamily epimerase YddE/YHI9
MKSLVFQQADVFTAVPFKGNPVAVVLDADDFVER